MINYENLFFNSKCFFKTFKKYGLQLDLYNKLSILISNKLARYIPKVILAFELILEDMTTI